MRSVFYVVKDNGRWKIEAGPGNLGLYSTRTEAIKAAVEAAAGAARNGHTTRVLAQIESPSTWETIMGATASADHSQFRSTSESE